MTDSRRAEGSFPDDIPGQVKRRCHALVPVYQIELIKDSWLAHICED